MKNRVLWLALIMLQGELGWALSSEVSFLQLARTTKRSGAAPSPGEEIPGIAIGTPPPQGPEEEREQLLYLERLLQRRKAEQEGAGAVQKAVADQSAQKPAASAASPSAVNVSRKEGQRKGGGMELRLTNASIESVVSTIMKELGYAYVIDPGVSGTVNLYTMGEIPRDKLFEVLEQVLKMNGHAIVKREDLYVIVPLNQSSKIPHQILVKPETRPRKEEEKPQVQEPAPPPGSPPGAGRIALSESASPLPPQEQTSGPTVLTVGPSEAGAQIESEQGVITYIIPLHHFPSSDMVNMIKAFLSDGALVIDFQPSNMLLITDYRQNIQQVLNLVELLDTQYFDINTVDLIPIRYNQAKDVAEDLGKIFAPGDKAGGVRIVAIERLNSLLVVTRSPAVFAEVMDWVHKLDAPSSGTNIRTYVYQVENNTAMNIAEVLAQLYQDGMGLPSGVPPEGQEGERGAAPATPRQPPQQEGRFLPPGQQLQGLGPSLRGRPMSTQQGVRAVVAGNVKIIVNEFNNSLIIQATEADYQFLLQTIKQLDILPRQVLIEVKIYSVELRDELSFGLAAFLQSRNRAEDAPPATTAQISPPGQGGTGGALNVVSRTIIGQARELEAAINALRSRTNVEVLEAPRVLAVDGMQARFNVGAEVPVTTASFGDPIRSGTATSFINSIQFRPTGTTVLFLPRISASGIVTMDLSIEVSSATGTALTPTINTNSVETSLIVRDGQTVAIAGIISDQLNVGRNRVPLLGDIPVLGPLFGQNSRNKRRFELVFFITPHVITTLPTATELTLEFRRSLRNAYEYIQRKEEQQKEMMQERRLKEQKPPGQR